MDKKEMFGPLIRYFLPTGLDIASDWTVFSRIRYLIFGHLITVLIAVLGIVVNVVPSFDKYPFVIDLGLSLIMLANLFLLKRNFVLCRFNFYVIVWAMVFVLSTFVRPLWGYQYYFMVWSASAVMLFHKEFYIYLIFLLGASSFFLSLLLSGSLGTEINFNPLFIFLLWFLIFRFFHSTNRYYIKTINQKNQQLENDKKLITQQAEKIEQISLQKNQFFTNISHEIRTPLTLITAPIRQLVEEALYLEPEHMQKLLLADSNGKRLTNLVEEILNISKLESGHLPLKVKESDLPSFLKGVLSSFSSLAETRDIQLKLESPFEKFSCWFDQGSLEKITINLLSNAFKFSEMGATIVVSLSEEQREIVNLTVKDTGSGISQEDLPNIFERFYHTESDIQPSSGLGLSIVKVIVERLGGTIEVKSEIGQGSEFSISFNVSKDHWDSRDLMDKQTEKPDAKKQKQEVDIFSRELNRNFIENETNAESILIIEDNHEMRSFLANTLSDRFQIHIAPDGQIGVEMAIDIVPDLIICDVMMPKKDGTQVCSELKQNEITNHIPIILLTAKADQKSKLTGLKNAADDYVTKPFDSSELKARIGTLLGNRKLIIEKFRNQPLFKSPDPSILSADKVFLEKIKKSIEENYSQESFTVESLAENLNMSRSQLNRKLQSLISTPPKSLIREFRLQKAYTLLVSEAATISEIAYRTGFSSPNYFNTVFKETFGQSPGEVKITPTKRRKIDG
ncbi:hybrid sensor histidine kinase/response regulator transcription factor [Reichenbachiella agariperforans]|nr:ATP-binding protein [Reichenbachiella agariperforans]